MQIDKNIAPLYSKKEKDDLAKYTEDFNKATTKSAKQAAHDSANAIRLKYADSVERIDFY
ncbi:hypothetical protein [Paenibacillus eucommiae]|uniref:Uncharacterized protein n=1 Tax=Paenibacillus eucommiae TaxID=1355755 RepID=A0ABS4IM86_9BACL|nr:hypothetical protein [Paenibacillus eucommiae]MBP1988692.1 hypothetical protein [Paenibacillus eucommiae]